jgi:hypothetical protein
MTSESTEEEGHHGSVDVHSSSAPQFLSFFEIWWGNRTTRWLMTKEGNNMYWIARFSYTWFISFAAIVIEYIDRKKLWFKRLTRRNFFLLNFFEGKLHCKRSLKYNLHYLQKIPKLRNKFWTLYSVYRFLYFGLQVNWRKSLVIILIYIYIYIFFFFFFFFFYWIKNFK